MMRHGLVFVCLVVGALGRPGYLSSPHLTILTAAARVGPDGRVIDTPEVTLAKAEHAVAHVNERFNLANEAVRSVQLVGQPTIVGSLVSGPVFVAGAPVGPDGRVVDTPEVAVAKAAHAAAHVNERINLANEAARSEAAGVTGHAVVPVGTGSVVSVAPVGPDGRVVDTPEVVVAKAAHAAAQVNERINLANEAVRSGGIIAVRGDSVVPVVTSNQVVASLVPGAPVGPDGRVRDTQEVAVAKAAHVAAHVNEKINLANEAVKSADVLAVAGPAFAYGRVGY